MPVNSNQYLQGINQTTGTGAPVHSAVAGDRYTDTATGITYQYTTSWQTVSYSGAGGLTYFTEAQNTTAPNATVPVDSLTAVTGTTDGDFAILPKGAGAILAQIPDGTITGGNKRGANAVDLQTTRTLATQVASGNYSAIIGGLNNTASGFGSFAQGTSTTASGGYSHAEGQLGIASATGAHVEGYATQASASYSHAEGQSTQATSQAAHAEGVNTRATNTASHAEGGATLASGTYSHAEGLLSVASGTASSVGGVSGSDFGVNTRKVFSANNTVLGDSQSSKLILNKRTTDASSTVLSVQDAAVSATTQLILQNNNSIRFKGTIIARQSGSTNTSAWDIDGFIQRGTTAATTTLLISNINVVQNTPAWGTPSLSANTTLGCLTVTVTGAITTNIQWVCVIDTAEVIYA